MIMNVIIFLQYLNFAMNVDICYNFFENLNQIKYLQPSTMKILLFILHYLSSYFMSLIMMFSLLIFNEYPFKQKNRLKKKEQNNKRHKSSKFLLDKIISVEDLNLIN